MASSESPSISRLNICGLKKKKTLIIFAFLNRIRPGESLERFRVEKGALQVLDFLSIRRSHIVRVGQKSGGSLTVVH